MYSIGEMYSLLCMAVVVWPKRWGGRGGDALMIMLSRSRMTIDPCIPTMPGQSTSGFHRPGRHLLAPSAKLRDVLGESHEGWAAS